MNNWDQVVTLIKETHALDSIGRQIPSEVKTTVFCKTRSIRSSEFYEAGQDGYKPEIEIIVHPYEYDNQELVEFEGIKYQVIRTYKASLEEIELTCEVKIGAN